jgi:ABC-2 type transport system permease protein
MTTFYIKILFLFRPIFLRLGVNFEQLAAIVEVKLKMDNRRSRFSHMSKSNKESNASFYWTLFLYMLFSTVFAVIIAVSGSITAVYSVVFSYIMVMLGMTLITDFSAVILDSSDNAVLLPRPIDDRTLFIARITHIMMYLLSILLALCIPTLIVTAVKHGIGVACMFLIISLLDLLLVVFLTNIFYLILMKFTSEERLRNIINSFQIVVTFIIMGGYRLVGRLINIDVLMSNVAVQTKWWHYLVPPIWMGNSMDVAINHHLDSTKFIFIFLTITVPFLVVFLVNNIFSDVFSQKISGIDIEKREEKQIHKIENEDFLSRLSKVFTGTPIERGAFEFVWKITARDRKFKLRVYPSLAYLLIYPILMIGSGNNNGSSIWQQVQNLSESPNIGIMIIYLCGTILLTIRSQISQSEEFKASWIYNLAPITQPGEILSGTLRSVLVKFVLPVCIVLSIVLSIIWGVSMLDDLIFGMLTIINLDLLLSIGMSSELPFSAEVKKNGGGSFARNLMYVFITGIIGIIHYFLMQVPYLIAVFDLFQLILSLYLFKKYREISWSKIRME